MYSTSIHSWVNRAGFAHMLPHSKSLCILVPECCFPKLYLNYYCIRLSDNLDTYITYSSFTQFRRYQLGTTT